MNPSNPKESNMRHASQEKIAAVCLAVLFASQLAFGQDVFYRPGPAPQALSPTGVKPSPHAAAATVDKLKDLGAHLGRALDIAFDLLSGNEAHLLSGNEADLLSKNDTALLSGNCPKVRLGDNPKVLSENRAAAFSGNSFSLFSNIKVEIHIDHSGNSMAAPPALMRPAPAPELLRTQPPKK
jgi:hypothetical protein